MSCKHREGSDGLRWPKRAQTKHFALFEPQVCVFFFLRDFYLLTNVFLYM